MLYTLIKHGFLTNQGARRVLSIFLSHIYSMRIKQKMCRVKDLPTEIFANYRASDQFPCINYAQTTQKFVVQRFYDNARAQPFFCSINRPH